MQTIEKLEQKLSPTCLKEKSQREDHPEVMKRIAAIPRPVEEAVILRIQYAILAADYIGFNPHREEWSEEELVHLDKDIEKQEEFYQKTMTDVLKMLGVEDDVSLETTVFFFSSNCAANPYDVLYELILESEIG